jgi:hypothetical protein
MLAAQDCRRRCLRRVAVGERISAARAGCGRSNVVTEKKTGLRFSLRFHYKEKNCG